MRVGERLLAEGYGVLVGYDYENQRSTALPDALCAKLRTNAHKRN
jgi:acyl-CoA thioesterase FadM